jgi:SAM-dependent methyltransferase
MPSRDETLITDPAAAWDAAAAAWDAFVETGLDFWRTEVHGPALLAACGDVRDQRVLDLGCGQGWFSRQLGSRAAIAVGLADLATLAAAREEWQPAARLFAKAEALLKAEAAAFSLPAREHYERAYRRATEALADSAQAEGAAGRALTLEQALIEAEAVLELEHD